MAAIGRLLCRPFWFAGAMVWAAARRFADAVVAIGSALLVLVTMLLALGRMLGRPDRFARRQIIGGLLDATLRPMPLTGLLAALLGVIFALAFAVALGVAELEDLLLPVLRQALTQQAMPLLIGLLLLGQLGLGLAARLAGMSFDGESDTLRSLAISPAEWVLPAALLSFLTFGAVQFLLGLGVSQLAAALVLQAQLGILAPHYADLLTSPAGRINVWDGLARSETSALFAWMVAATAGVMAAPAPGEVGRAVRATFLITLLGLLAIAAAFTWFGA